MKPTITIGIPAYNEARNIGSLLLSIANQKASNYQLKQIIVVDDGSDDNTTKIVADLKKHDGRIKLISGKKRLGKARRLNQIYRLNQSDYLLSLDADVLFATRFGISHMVNEVINNQVTLVGARLIPEPQQTFMGQVANVSYQSFEEAVLKLNQGINYYSLVGCASLIRADLVSRITYPPRVISDQNYLFAVATRDGLDHYRLAKKAEVSFRTVATWQDWRKLSSRSVVGDKANLVHFFGQEELKHYTMPKSLLAKALIKWWVKHPILTTASVMMNLYIRLFPYHQTEMSQGLWQPTQSSKEVILN